MLILQGVVILGEIRYLVFLLFSRFIVANKARQWMTRTKEERAKTIAQSMAKVFGLDELLDVSPYNSSMTVTVTGKRSV